MKARRMDWKERLALSTSVSIPVLLGTPLFNGYTYEACAENLRVKAKDEESTERQQQLLRLAEEFHTIGSISSEYPNLRLLIPFEPFLSGNHARFSEAMGYNNNYPQNLPMGAYR